MTNGSPRKKPVGITTGDYKKCDKKKKKDAPAHRPVSYKWMAAKGLFFSCFWAYDEKRLNVL